jgi:hypothetical protein
MTHVLLLAASLIALGCGGTQKPDDGTGGGSGAGSAAGSGSAAGDGPITRGECEQMVSHILDVGVAESKRTKPEAEWPTDQQVEQIRSSMMKDEKGLQKCMAFDRESLACVMKATDTAALEQCLGPEE